MRAKRYGILALILLFAGCGSEPGPAAVMESWLEHLTHGEMAAAYGLLSADSQSALAEAEEAWIGGREHALAPADPPTEVPEGPPGFLLFCRLAAGPGFHGAPPLPGDAPQRVGDEAIQGDDATVTVRTASGPRDARLVRETGAWRVAVVR